MSRRSSLPIRLCLAIGALAGAITLSAPAAAGPAFTLDRATIGGGLRFASEDLNLGLGVRGGYTLDMGLYIGGVFDYWFGESDDTVVGEISYSAWDLMAVAGYDFGVTPSIVIRPFGGFGIVHQEVDCEVEVFPFGQLCGDASDTDAGAVLGVEALFELGKSLHIGPEIRIIIFDDVAFSFGGNIGGTF